MGMRVVLLLPSLLVALTALGGPSAGASPLDGSDPWESGVDPAPLVPALELLDPWNGPAPAPASVPRPAPSLEDPWDDAPLRPTPPVLRTLDANDPWDSEATPSPAPLDSEDPWPEAAETSELSATG
jgi:hypothetical protein